MSDDYQEEFERSASDFAGKLRMAATYPNYVLWAIIEHNSAETEGGRKTLRARGEQVMRDAVRVAEVAREYLEQLASNSGESEPYERRLAQVLGWGDFRKCSAAQTEEFAAWARELGLSHLGQPHIREELFS